MTDDEDDRDLLRLYRGQAQEMPPAALDVRILAASRVADKRWWLLAVPAAAIAAGLVLVFQPLWHAPRMHSSAASSFADAGLHDGLVAQQLADPQAMRRMAIMQQPGGSDGGNANGL